MLICAPFLEYAEEKKKFENTEIVSIDLLCNYLIESIKNEGDAAFFARYTEPCHLVICDVECLEGKERTQGEIEKLVSLRKNAGKPTTFLSSVTAERMGEALTPRLFETITQGGFVDKF